MATFQKGILGGFSGLVGTIVGSTWRSLDVMKSRPKKSNKVPVQSQIDQRLKFALVTAFLKGVKAMIEIGYQANNKVLTPMNAAVRYHLDNAVTGVSPAFTLDYSKVVLSNGTLPSPENLLVVPVAGGTLTITWDALDGYSDPETALRNLDTMTLMIYSPVNKRYVSYLAGPARGLVLFSAKLPRVFIGTPLHIVLFFVALDGKSASDSEYFGPVTAIA